MIHLQFVQLVLIVSIYLLIVQNVYQDGILKHYVQHVHLVLTANQTVQNV